jgi:hypothetical protein
MLRTLSLTLLFFVLTCLAFSAEMVVKEPMTEVFGDIDAIKNDVQDANGKDCALVKINTDLLPFDKIESPLFPVKIINKASEVWVYLSAGERRLYFSKTGYAKLVYDIPVVIESNKVYTMKIIGSGINLSKAIGITIKITPADAIVVIADTITCNISKPVFLESGKYNISLSKSGYTPITNQIEVSKDNIFFEYTLAKEQDIPVEIYSTPAGAEVYIDDVKLGITPLSTFYPSGTYKIKLTKEWYANLEEKTTIKFPKATLNYTLKPNFATLNIDSKPESGMAITLNNKKTTSTTPYTYEKILPGHYILEAEKQYFKTDKQELDLIAGDKKTITLSSRRLVGDITVTSSPQHNMDIYIDGQSIGQQTPHTITNLEPRIYIINAKSTMYLSDTLYINLKASETKTAALTPLDNFALLTINAPEKAEVYLNGQKLLKRKDYQLEPMQATVKVTLSKASDIVERVVLKRGDIKVMNLQPVVASGTIQIAVMPIDAEINLTGDAGEYYQNAGTKIYNGIPIGEYKLKVKKDGYKSYNETVLIGKDQKITKSITLIEGKDIPTNTPSNMVYVEGGTFTMGDTAGYGSDDEKPTHQVTLSSFYIGKYEVTQKQWQDVMGSNPSYFKGDVLPVEKISWYDCIVFCNKLSQKEGLTSV